MLTINKNQNGYQYIPDSVELHAENHSKIKTFGIKLLYLYLGLRRDFKWYFIVPEISAPINGVGFLRNFNLLVGLGNKKLIRRITKLGSSDSLTP